MNAQDDDRAGVSVEPGNIDVIESGSPRPHRIGVGFVLVLVVVAGLVGYLYGSRHRAATTATPAPSVAPAVAQPIAATTKRCSVQLKDRLQLGIEIINQSATALTLSEAQAVLPLHGLRPTATTWGSCGQLPPAVKGGAYPLPAGATTWLAITFDVLVPCPAPIPVLFTVQYTQANQPGTADLPGFSDLGDVPYTSTDCH